MSQRAALVRLVHRVNRLHRTLYSNKAEKLIAAILCRFNDYIPVYILRYVVKAAEVWID